MTRDLNVYSSLTPMQVRVERTYKHIFTFIKVNLPVVSSCGSTIHKPFDDNLKLAKAISVNVLKI